MELYLGSKSPKPARTVQLDLWQLVSLKKRKRSPGKYLLSLSLSVLSDSLRPMGCSLSGFSVHWILACVVIPFSRASSQPRDWICLLHWQADSLSLCHLGSLTSNMDNRKKYIRKSDLIYVIPVNQTTGRIDLCAENNRYLLHAIIFLPAKEQFTGYICIYEYCRCLITLWTITL